jgi:hypothetical protein
MFLDDQLLKICEEREIKSSQDVNETIHDVFQTCNTYLKERIVPGTSKIEALAIIHKSFKLFDCFVEKLKVSKNPEVRGFYFYFSKFSWKDMFLSIEEGKVFYEDCVKSKKLMAVWN